MLGLGQGPTVEPREGAVRQSDLTQVRASCHTDEGHAILLLDSQGADLVAGLSLHEPMVGADTPFRQTGRPQQPQSIEPMIQDITTVRVQKLKGACARKFVLRIARP
ncbi:MAG TPA: hypothetical protein EYQ31_17040, partial [Candidatus Handelsmanbacteria bacterium]|nr:hypothetical protein [Candidatus Handelsmanbacteria bacterium]